MLYSNFPKPILVCVNRIDTIYFKIPFAYALPDLRLSKSMFDKNCIIVIVMRYKNIIPMRYGQNVHTTLV